jgi:hypothetical protein
MPYSNFTLPEVIQQFGLVLDTGTDLFAAVPGVPVGELLAATLAETVPLAQMMHTEKARSELIVAPMLVEVRRRMNRRISLFSGADFPVDQAAGLSGACDFLVSRSPNQLIIEAPVLIVVEAKRDSIPDGLGQCAAGMVGAQRFNDRRGNPDTTVYGCVTTGSNWKFLRLRGTGLAVDVPEYQINDPERILGILLACIGGGQPVVAAA